MTHQPSPRSPRPDDPAAQVAAASEAIARDERAAKLAGAAAAGGRRRLPGWAAVVALLGFALSVALNGENLRGTALDLDAQIDGTIQSIEYARRAVEAYRDSAGVLPATLVDVGLGDLPFAYTREGTAFRIAALVATGDSVGYQSPSGLSWTGENR